MPEATRVLLPTFVALCLGALVGLERQVAQRESGDQKDFPGMRTFAFLALVGALAVLLRELLGPWMAVALFSATALFLVLRYRHDTALRGDPGYTTEIASLCTFAVGALAQSGQLLVATVITIAMVALLRSKRTLHRASNLLEPTDMEALIRFLVLAGIVLPLLPAEPLDHYLELPYLEVLRPRDVWRMVVLISGVSFLGYALMRLRLGQGSQLLMGLLAGLVSSTAAAASYSRAAGSAEGSRALETLVVLAAATAFLRMALMLALVGPRTLPSVGLPLLALFCLGLVLAALLHRPGEERGEQPLLANPLKLKLAFGFAAAYALILLVVAIVGDRVGERAVFVVSALAGLAGADAPNLSLARLHAHGQLPLQTAAAGILVVAIATTLGKVGIVLSLAPGAFSRRVVPTLLVLAAAGGAMIGLWI